MQRGDHGEIVVVVGLLQADVGVMVIAEICGVMVVEFGVGIGCCCCCGWWSRLKRRRHRIASFCLSFDCLSVGGVVSLVVMLVLGDVEHGDVGGVVRPSL